MSRSHEASSKQRPKEQELREASDQGRTSVGKPGIVIASTALIVVTAVIVLVATGVGAIAGSSGQRSSDQMNEVSALLRGIPQQGDALGQASAPITLQIFGDLESEDVRTFVVWILPDIIRDWVRTNTVKIQYKSLMNDPSYDSKVFVSQQAAALAAGAQDKLWNFVEVFYHDQGREHTPYVTENYLENIAQQVPGLNLSQWRLDRENVQLAKQVVIDNRTAHSMGFYYTPAFLVGRTGGSLIPWSGYRLYEEKAARKGSIRRSEHPVSFMTSQILRTTIEHLP